MAREPILIPERNAIARTFNLAPKRPLATGRAPCSVRAPWSVARSGEPSCGGMIRVATSTPEGPIGHAGADRAGLFLRIGQQLQAPDHHPVVTQEVFLADLSAQRHDLVAVAACHFIRGTRLSRCVCVWLAVAADQLPCASQAARPVVATRSVVLAASRAAGSGGSRSGNFSATAAPSKPSNRTSRSRASAASVRARASSFAASAMKAC